jgi:hypothetical protein
MPIVEWLYERLTGKPYWTERSMRAEYGPPPAEEFAAELAGYSDEYLLRHGDEVLADLRARARQPALTR